VKPNINSVEAHPQPSNNKGHPVDACFTPGNGPKGKIFFNLIAPPSQQTKELKHQIKAWTQHERE